jgi:hypothetical protein
MDKRNKFIDFIIEDLINNTFIDNEIGGGRFYRRLYVPYNDIDYRILQSIHIDSVIDIVPKSSLYQDFPKYVTDRYGVRREDAIWVYDMYKRALMDRISNKGNINESKQERFQQFIYDDFINNFTRIRGKGRYSRLMFIEPIDNEPYVMWTIGDVSSSGKLRQFEPDENYTDWFLDNEVVKLFKNRYGIEDVDKIHDMWLGILDRLYIKMTENTFNDNTLNESTKKDMFIKHIVDDFLSRHLRLSDDPQDIADGYEMALDFDTDLWNFDYTDLIDFWLDDHILNSSKHFDKQFIKKMGDYYGITKKEEIQYIYREIVKEMIKRTKSYLIRTDRFIDDFGNPINESMNKEEKFRNFIIDDFVEKMDIRDGHATMWFDDNQFRRDFNGYKRHYNPYEGIKNDIESGYRFEFDRYMRDLYGITTWKDITMLWYYVTSRAASKISRTLR